MRQSAAKVWAAFMNRLPGKRSCCRSTAFSDAPCSSIHKAFAGQAQRGQSDASSRPIMFHTTVFRPGWQCVEANAVFSAGLMRGMPPAAKGAASCRQSFPTIYEMPPAAKGAALGTRQGHHAPEPRLGGKCNVNQHFDLYGGRMAGKQAAFRRVLRSRATAGPE